MKYTVELTVKARKFINKLQSRDAKLVADAISGLAVDPFTGDVKKLKGLYDTFRKRAGNYRIIFEVDGNRVVITVLQIGHRKDVYNDF